MDFQWAIIIGFSLGYYWVIIGLSLGEESEGRVYDSVLAVAEGIKRTMNSGVDLSKPITLGYHCPVIGFIGLIIVVVFAGF